MDIVVKEFFRHFLIKLLKLPEEMKLLPKELLSDHTVWHGKGCGNCVNSGYRGRIGIYEIMEITEAIREAMLLRKSSAEIKRLAQFAGMKTMVEDGFTKAFIGITTIEEVFRVIHE